MYSDEAWNIKLWMGFDKGFFCVERSWLNFKAFDWMKWGLAGVTAEFPHFKLWWTESDFWCQIMDAGLKIQKMQILQNLHNCLFFIEYLYNNPWRMMCIHGFNVSSMQVMNTFRRHSQSLIFHLSNLKFRQIKTRMKDSFNQSMKISGSSLNPHLLNFNVYHCWCLFHKSPNQILKTEHESYLFEVATSSTWLSILQCNQ